MSKITAFAAPAVMALAVAAPSEAKVLLMGDGGWEVSFDGSVNSFYVFSTKDELDAADTATNATHTGSDADGEDTSRITVGLLPAVWGMNIKAPTTNGLDMSSRIGLYPSVQNGRSKNTSSAVGGQNGGNLDLREIFFAVEGSSGKLLVGRTLGLFQGKNILTDMTLFGVGAGSGSGAGTTLGRIGWGYVYPNFNAGIRYTTPDANGIKAEFGIFDPSTMGGNSINGSPTVTETSTPRFEMELSYAGNISGVTTSAWANGMVQNSQRSNTEIQTLCGLVINGGGPSSLVPPTAHVCTVESHVTVGGGAFGAQLGYAGLTLTGSGYIGKGLGSTLMIDSDAIDAKGQTRPHSGYIAQGTYAFGQGTSVGGSYGESRASETSTDLLQRATAGVGIESQGMMDFMVWHDINKNLRVVAEYSQEEREWHDGVEQDATNVALGGFFFW